MKPNYNCRQVLPTELELMLVKYLVSCAKMCYGVGYVECRKFAYELSIKNNLSVPDTWNKNKMAGIEWMRSFMKRNSGFVSLRKPESCSFSRATSFNKHNVSFFFKNLQNVMKRCPSFADGSRIFNLDETGVTTVQSPTRVIAQKGVKRLNQITSGERGVLVTVCCVINAYGNKLPPTFIFPRVNFKSHMQHGAPPGSLGLACQSGWMNSDLFIETLNHFIKHTNSSKDTPSLLIMDNHESHVSLNSLSVAKDNGVTILTLPPHCSNRLQPLDVSVYGPFKSYYNSAVDSWLQRNSGKAIDIYHVAECVNIAFEKSMTPANITAGFKATGIFPFDENIFTDDDFAVSAVTDRLIDDVYDQNTQIKPNKLFIDVNASGSTSSKNAPDTPENQVEETPTNKYISPQNIRPFQKLRQEKKILIKEERKTVLY